MSSFFKSTTTSTAAPAPAPVNRVQAFLDAFFATNPSLSEVGEMAGALNKRADEIRADAQRSRLHVVWDTTAADFRRAHLMDVAAAELRESIVEAHFFLLVPEPAEMIGAGVVV